MNNEGLKIPKLIEVKETGVMHIKVDDAEEEIEIGHEVKDGLRKAIMKMIKDYKANEMQTTNVEMKIILTH